MDQRTEWDFKTLRGDWWNDIRKKFTGRNIILCSTSCFIDEKKDHHFGNPSSDSKVSSCWKSRKIYVNLIIFKFNVWYVNVSFSSFFLLSILTFAYWHSSGKEMSRRKGTFENLRSKANQMASALDMLKFSNIDILLRPEKDDIMSRVIGLDNQGIVGLHRQVMKGKLVLS